MPNSYIQSSEELRRNLRRVKTKFWQRWDQISCCYYYYYYYLLFIRWVSFTR